MTDYKRLGFTTSRMADISPVCPIPITILLGPTASGKSELALEVALRTQAEIISADSMQVYRGMDIGTAKPTLEQRNKVPHHLVDICDLTETFSVAEFVRQADREALDIHRRGKPILLTGGSALYIKGFIEGIFEGPPCDAALRERLTLESSRIGIHGLHGRLAAVDLPAANRIHPNDLRRIVRALEVWELTGKPISSWQQQQGRRRSLYAYRILGLRLPREELYRRIDARVDAMMAGGIVEETRRLLEGLPRWAGGPLQALGYREIVAYLEGQMDLHEAIHQIKQASRQFAKRQICWYKQFPEVVWFDLTGRENRQELVDWLMPQFFA